MGITATLKGNITLTDNITGSVSLSKPVNNTYTGTVETYGQSIVVGTTQIGVTLPISPTQFVYVKNLSITAGTLLTVTWTPNSGASATIITLDPGAMIIFSEVGTANGVASLSLQSNQAGTPCEYILCG